MKPIPRKERRFYEFVDGRHPESKLFMWFGKRLYEAYPWDAKEYEEAPFELRIINDKATHPLVPTASTSSFDGKTTYYSR